MHCFLEMTTLNGDTIFIRADEIVAIEGLRIGEGISQTQNNNTRVHLVHWGGNYLDVQEYVRDVAKLLREA